MIKTKSQPGEGAGMTRFFHIKIYRRTFLVYITTLLCTCIIVSFFSFRSLIGSRVPEHRNNSLRIFSESEQLLSECYNSIDRFLVRVYSDAAMVQDFYAFFQNTPDAYIASKLDRFEPGNQSSSYLEYCQGFVADSGYTVSRITYSSAQGTLTVTYQPNGQVDYQPLSPGEPAQAANIPGFVYERELSGLNDPEQEVGVIRFYVDPSRLFAKLPSGLPGCCLIAGEEGYLTLSPGEDGFSGDMLEKLSAQTAPEGSLGILSPVYYTVSQSNQYGYRFITALGLPAVIRLSRWQFLTFALVLLLIFAVMFLIFLLRISRDAGYMTQILAFIDRAKAGVFQPVSLKPRSDEYGLIAQQLNELSTQLNEHIEREYVLKLNQQKTEMQMLQTQINPHFLYNTLEIIRLRALEEDCRDVSDAITNLGSIYRSIVKLGESISIQQELEIAEQYLKLMAFRYRDSFFYQIDVEPQCLSQPTVKLWMQPVLENFFTHNFTNSSIYKVILINGVQTEEGGYEFSFVNNESSIPEKRLEEINSLFSPERNSDGADGVGLQNVYFRLRYFYGKGLQLKLSNNDKAGITVTVRIPPNASERF